ncbi:MAG: hypothetical protein CVV25_09425 [Ignavibacteriae bacterium HGW-Ignavibacteriae-4]|nr:MAG: hypothetical protein CVV25_09425 [Ignavibacteriae bacterium HGW-Ignavibacteriae-4]
MSRLRNTFNILLLLLISTTTLRAIELLDSDLNYKVGIGFNYSGLSSYYDNSSVEKPNIKGLRTFTFKLESGDSTHTTLGDININYTEFHNNYYFEYKLNNDLTAELNMDLAYYSLDNKFTYLDTLRDEDQIPLKDIRGNVLSQKINAPDLNTSLFRLMYINPKINYLLINDKYNKLKVEINALVPLSFNNTSEYKDGPFIGDGFLQIGTKLNYRAIYETMQLQLGAGYLNRSEVYSDQVNARLGVMFTKVKDTYFYIMADYNHSLTNPDNLVFAITQLPAYDSYLSTMFGLNINIDNLELDMSYTFVPWGKNYWVMNRLNASFHYLLK